MEFKMTEDIDQKNSEKLKKFQKLNDIFDMAETTVNDLDDEQYSTDVAIFVDDNEDELITTKTLRNDLKIIRETLLSTIQKGKSIIDTITIDIVQNGMVDSKLVDAVANLIKSTNSSMKDLSSIFKDLQDLEDRKKNRTIKTDAVQQISNTQNNIYVGNASQLLEMLNKQ